ncbi:hypothetical protein V8B55DRAFT_1545967 [Mucor lusitanicus]|uniref:Uncharacterized protein n=2 Tax=Mucor circinelloides f. lusitanicus TaxID=29924 RepID=A0A162RK18_MUCCL|nr:hypothetical protein FB192DRAFT_1449761 [Mucor lusitanicus]OAD06669.1 hypothetical protein MUCCIDRAFT_107252 [Mucor lusitanicus CBS 277.49]
MPNSNQSAWHTCSICTWSHQNPAEQKSCRTKLLLVLQILLLLDIWKPSKATRPGPVSPSRIPMQIGAKRLSEEDPREAFTTSKKARLLDLDSILDKAMQKFEEQMNSVNTKTANN